MSFRIDIHFVWSRRKTGALSSPGLLPTFPMVENTDNPTAQDDETVGLDFISDVRRAVPSVSVCGSGSIISLLLQVLLPQSFGDTGCVKASDGG